MAGVEHGNVTNEEFMEEVARYECVYNRNSKDFKDKKNNSWQKIGEKFILSAAEAEVKFRNIQNGCFLRTKRRNKFACSKSSSSMSAMLFASISSTRMYI